jgi:uncharacterized membrane protein YeiH
VDLHALTIDDLYAWGTQLRVGVEALATLAFALSGVLAGARKRLDVVGVWVVLVVSVLSMRFLRLRGRHHRLTERAILWPDAVGLGLFTASGVHHALVAQMPLLVAVLMGVVTGMFGGVLRDMVCNEVPASLRDRRPYALLSFLGGWVYIACQFLTDWPAWAAVLACVSVTVGLRMLALWRDWRLPSWRT